MARGGDTRAAAAAHGKKVGRPQIPKITLHADKGIATTVLAMDGPPQHVRKCPCEICTAKAKERRCECVELESDKGEKKIKVECRFCRIREEHAICRCEICGWWDLLSSSDRRIRLETRRYLTDRRDGKPAQGVFVGDTRELMAPLSRGNVPSYFAPGKSSRVN